MKNNIKTIPLEILEVKEIKKLYAKGILSQSEIAEMYGQHRNVVFNIIHLNTFKNI